MSDAVKSLLRELADYRYGAIGAHSVAQIERIDVEHSSLPTLGEMLCNQNTYSNVQAAILHCMESWRDSSAIDHVWRFLMSNRSSSLELQAVEVLCSLGRDGVMMGIEYVLAKSPREEIISVVVSSCRDIIEDLPMRHLRLMAQATTEEHRAVFEDEIRLRDKIHLELEGDW